ncbi:MAG: hypothetical protein ACREPU_06680 [Rhodanobacteraceae bacterium]
MATFLAVGAVGIAHATPNLVQNGDFSQTSPTPANPTQIGPDYTAGQFVTGWTGNGYAIWYPSATAAVSGCGHTQYHSGAGGDCSTLNVVGTPVPGSGSFVALDGVSGSLQGSISQLLSGLTVGSTYTVSFYWGTTQETQASSKVQSHDQYLQVSLGGATPQTTNTVLTDWNTFNGWYLTTMNFTADSSSALLDFLSIGLPADGPPMILLTGVTLTQNVPEPPELAMFGGGLLGLGLLILFARRREMRRRAADGGSSIV